MSAAFSPVTINKGGFHRGLTRLVDTNALTDAQKKFNLKIMQFNVLANCLKDRETKEEFQVRKQLNIDYILAMAPSLLLLEEVDAPEVYGSELEKNGYAFVAHHKNNETKDFTMVCYRPEDGLKLVEQEIQFFVPTLHSSASVEELAPTAGGVDETDPGSPQLSEGMSSQFAFHCRFSHYDEPLYVIGQHAKAGRTDEMEEKRISHSKQVLMKLAAYLEGKDEGEKYKDRVLWLGDMNAGPHCYGQKYPSMWYPWVMGEEEEGKRHHDPHPFRWTSAMREGRGTNPLLAGKFENPQDSESTHTTVKMRHGALIKQCIDYVFYSRGSFQVTGYSEPPPAEDMAPDYLPSNVWGSDHLSVYVELCPTAKLVSKA